MYVFTQTCKCFLCFFFKSILMYAILHWFIIPNGDARYSLNCLSEKFNARETKADDLNVPFNPFRSSLCLSWDLSIFFFVHVFIFSFLFLLSENGTISFFACQSDFLLQFYPRLFHTPFTIIPVGSRNVIGFQYLRSQKMYHQY